MDYARWAPYYERIRQEFGFPWAREEAAAELLEHLLPASRRVRVEERIGPKLRGRKAVVIGLAPGSGAPPLWALPSSEPSPVLLAADGAAAPCLAAGIVPDVLVTDLDGPVPAEVAANQRGSVAVVHAHGDNRPALAEWVPQFPGAVEGSWAGAPRPGLVNFGGFTDGDRAAFLAEALGARQILLYGFDFEHVGESDPTERSRKIAKLRWARTLLDVLAAEGRASLCSWRNDGTVEPWNHGDATRSTQ